MCAPNSQICQVTWQIFVIGTMCQSLHCFAGPQTCSNMHGIELCLVRHLQCLRHQAVGIAVHSTYGKDMLEIFLAKLGTCNPPLIPNFAEALHSLDQVYVIDTAANLWNEQKVISELNTWLFDPSVLTVVYKALLNTYAFASSTCLTQPPKAGSDGHVDGHVEKQLWSIGCKFPGRSIFIENNRK